MRRRALPLFELTITQDALAKSDAIRETEDCLAVGAETIRIQLFGTAIVAEEGQS